MTVYRLTRTWSDPEMQRRAQWVANMMSGSEKTANLLGVSPEMIVGQSALESGWGRSAVGQFNVFGIKDQPNDEWHGKRVSVYTREVINGQEVMMYDWFRDYGSYQESIDDHFSFLQKNLRYAAAGVFEKKGDEHFAAALKKAGYATDPNYVQALIDMRDTVRNYFLPYMTTSEHALVSPPDVPTQSRRWLMIGSSGTDVAELQKKLGFVGKDIDGRFGPNTRAAVVAFQQAHPETGPADGVVGDRTHAALWK